MDGLKDFFQWKYRSGDGNLWIDVLSRLLVGFLVIVLVYSLIKLLVRIYRICSTKASLSKENEKSDSLLPVVESSDSSMRSSESDDYPVKFESKFSSRH